MSEFVNRFESENAKLPGTNVKDSMGYFPLSHPHETEYKRFNVFIVHVQMETKLKIQRCITHNLHGRNLQMDQA